MQIEKRADGDRLTIAVKGRLDTSSAPALEQCIDDSIDRIKALVLDFKEMTYISSAGLRIILKTQKQMNNQQGMMKLVNVRDEVMEIFHMTGFSDILMIE